MDLPREAIGPERSNCFSRGSILVFQRTHIITFDFPGVTDPCPHPLSGYVRWLPIAILAK